MFIQPLNYGNKAVWENCAKILVRKTDKELEPYLNELFAWLQDFNWPGAMFILDRLKTFDAKKIKYSFESSVEEASKNGDINWLSNLLYFLKNSNLNHQTDSECLKILLENEKIIINLD